VSRREPRWIDRTALLLLGHKLQNSCVEGAATNCRFLTFGLRQGYLTNACF
jgi:hypothetical protein